MSTEWIYVTGKKSFKSQRRNEKSQKEARNHGDHLSLGPSVVDEGVVAKNLEKVTKQIYNVYRNEREFLVNLLTELKKSLSSENTRVYALGCGTIENQSLVLSKSCIYQMGVCIIIIKALGVKVAHIYDPVMTRNDHEVWNKLMTQRYDFEELVDSVHSEAAGTDGGRSEHGDHGVCTLLWMPHCEKFLYRAVLRGILSNRSPLDVSRGTRKANDDPAASEFTTTDDKLASEPNDLEHHPPGKSQNVPASEHLAAGSAQSPQPAPVPGGGDLGQPSAFSIETTTLVGNSLAECVSEELGFLADYALTERPLLTFNTHPQSFNDTFVTSFKLQKYL
ncbi:conserved hypothetical protein [Theileria orientalis strain Shintoku]|uniref:SRR1-like domain-containing protein n=1 Tax=Theileria orientalis strain Shintoku TaxID=869250 RepID=J4DNR7_THEOR|nr:conserved hypothetical protein [Theileria orientalis strain Shintoku]BAM39429.1 conserved hypothetical protein [Theileria orientalis strain Shintoku]|eukprot:XP_009689730.1 conserved hypothetical protein [Theileria orientalis strain Shintoku]